MSTPQGSVASIPELLLGFWKETLVNDALTLDDDVLMLGATSVQIMSVIGRVAQDLSIEVPLEALFDAITIGDQADVLLSAAEA